MPIQTIHRVDKSVSAIEIRRLTEYLSEFATGNSRLELIRDQVQKIRLDAIDSIPTLIALYDEVYPELEYQLWSAQGFDQLLDTYQSLFREQETLIQMTAEDNRYDFIIGIPIADRPEHLRCCLESIYQLCLLYSYGGRRGAHFAKVQVVVAEDSREARYIQQDIVLCEHYSSKGLRVVHFAQDEQYQMLQAIPEQQRQHLASILTAQGKKDFSRKGQAAMRNLSYLKMLQLARDPQRTLFFPVDSDQTFQVNVVTDQGERVLPALNYFYAINRIFQQTDTTMLTGKLVGDPPVSPAVMTANFILDVTRFIDRLSELDPQHECAFHQLDFSLGHDAAYHDMSALFGFNNREEGYDYPCPLTTEHTNLQCMNEFSAQLSYFFSGQHPTRKTHFKFEAPLLQLAPARTIYPGNYIVNFDGLKYVIPFGHLRLRMSGPTAGRLVQAELGDRFATVNLPMLHTRTQPGDEENFRPGVESVADQIDLSDEFERQFFGDLMLFSVAELVSETDLRSNPDRSIVEHTLQRVQRDLLEQYQQKHAEVLRRVDALEGKLTDNSQWWHQDPSASEAIQSLEQFCRNVRFNFGTESKAYRLIHSQQHREQRSRQIAEALMQYPQARDAWDSLF